VSGVVAAYQKASVGDMMLGAVVMYTVLTAWLAARHRKNETNTLEILALIWIISLAILSFAIYMGWRQVDMPSAYLIWGGFAILCILGDVRNLRLSGLSDTQRIIRHIWRIGFSL